MFGTYIPFGQGVGEEGIIKKVVSAATLCFRVDQGIICLTILPVTRFRRCLSIENQSVVLRVFDMRRNVMKTKPIEM